MTKVYKLEIMVIDHDEIGGESIKSIIENTRYTNRCINPRVMTIESKSINWTDYHPLNISDGKDKKAFEKLFEKI